MTPSLSASNNESDRDKNNKNPNSIIFFKLWPKKMLHFQVGALGGLNVICDWAKRACDWALTRLIMEDDRTL